MKRVSPVVAGVGGMALGVALMAALGLAPREQPAAARIGTADVLGIVERMLASDRYRPPQEAFLKGENEKLRPLADELSALENRLNNLGQGNADAERLSREFDDKQQAFQKSRQEAFARIDQYNTDQVREAYRLTLDAVNELAEKQGYAQVVASRTGEATIRSQNVPGALQEILARPMARSLAADDLTERLIRQFKLEGVKLEDSPRAGAGAQPGMPGRAPEPPVR